MRACILIPRLFLFLSCPYICTQTPSMSSFDIANESFMPCFLFIFESWCTHTHVYDSVCFLRMLFSSCGDWYLNKMKSH